MSIQVDNLVKQFNAHTAVDDVTFQVKEGEFVTLLGPSGSGKSTILRCIAGLEFPSSGKIEISGKNVTNVAVQDRQIGFVFQHYALFRHMSVLDNVAFGLKVRNISKTERYEKARELIKLVGLNGLEKRFPNQLSGGQRQRVALARALAPQPELLLLDEPFGALDTRLRKELRSWLRTLHDKIKLTTLLVTHDQEEAFELSDRILVINKGKVEQDATPAVVFNTPATEFTATFVGETNSTSGVVSEGDVAWGPFRFKATHLKQGDKAHVHFRPTDVYVSSHREKGGWPGKITSLKFMGSFHAIEITLEDKTVLTAHVPAGVSEQSDFHEGKNVYVMITKFHVYKV